MAEVILVVLSVSCGGDKKKSTFGQTDCILLEVFQRFVSYFFCSRTTCEMTSQARLGWRMLVFNFFASFIVIGVGRRPNTHDVCSLSTNVDP